MSHEFAKSLGVAMFLTAFAQVYLREYAQIQPGYYQNVLLALRSAPGGLGMFIAEATATYAFLKNRSSNKD